MRKYFQFLPAQHAKDAYDGSVYEVQFPNSVPDKFLEDLLNSLPDKFKERKILLSHFIYHEAAFTCYNKQDDDVDLYGDFIDWVRVKMKPRFYIAKAIGSSNVAAISKEYEIYDVAFYDLFLVKVKESVRSCPGNLDEIFPNLLDKLREKGSLVVLDTLFRIKKHQV